MLNAYIQVIALSFLELYIHLLGPHKYYKEKTPEFIIISFLRMQHCSQPLKNEG